MTDEQRQRYVAKKGGRCPYCDSDEIGGGAVDIDSGGASQEVECLQCAREWIDYYQLVDVQPADDEEVDCTAIVDGGPT